MNLEHAAARPAGRHRRLPEHERHDRRRRRRRGARAARPPARGRVREGRHRRRGRRTRAPARRRRAPSISSACTAESPAPPTPIRRAACGSRSRSGPTRSRPGVKTRELETRVPRGRRGDPRAARRRRPHLRVRPLDPRAPARSPTPPPTPPTSPSSRRSSCSRRSTSSSGSSSRCGSSASAWPSCRCASASATTSRRARRSSSASTSCASRWSRSARSSARTTRSVADDYRTKIAEAGMPDDVREQAERELGRLERMGDQSGESSMIRTYLDWLLAVPWAKRSEERLDPVHAREVLDADHAGPRGRQGAHRRVPRRAQAPPGARHRRGQALGRDPDADRPARHRQDVDRRVDRARAQPRVRAHVARRRARRGGDPRPPPHLHRRAAGPARPRAARRRDDEPGDPARRGRQGRRRLARRSLGGAARGARPGAEPLVPRPLPRRRARPVRGRLHRDRERRRHDPRPAARPHGGDPLRRLHGRREGRDRARLPLAAPARAAGLLEDEVSIDDDHARADRQPSTRARPASASSSASSASCCARRRRRIASATPSRRSRSTRRRSATRSAGSASTRRRPSGPPCRASRPASPSPAPAATSSSSRRRRWTARTGSCSPASSAT